MSFGFSILSRITHLYVKCFCDEYLHIFSISRISFTCKKPWHFDQNYCMINAIYILNIIYIYRSTFCPLTRITGRFQNSGNQSLTVNVSRKSFGQCGSYCMFSVWSYKTYEASVCMCMFIFAGLMQSFGAYSHIIF